MSDATLAKDKRILNGNYIEMNLISLKERGLCETR